MYHYFRAWHKSEWWQHLYDTQHERVRVYVGRNPIASAGMINSQWVKITDRGGVHGFDDANTVNGRKRHIVVDVLGFPVFCEVHAADLSDRDGARPRIKLSGLRLPHCDLLMKALAIFNAT